MHNHRSKNIYFTYTSTYIESIRLVVHGVKRMEIRDKVENEVKLKRHLA